MTALTSLLGNDAHGESSTDVPKWNGLVSPRHVPPKAKRVIFLYMAGGPSHLETFDHRPQLTKLPGQPMPESFTKGQPIAQLQGKKLTCMAPQHRFRKCGDSGIEISTAFEHLPQVADELCIVRSLRTEAINHDPAHTFMNTGTSISGRPAIGSWLLYGLGSPSNNLPGFIVMTSTGGGQSQPISARQWHSGFLPGQFQGVHFNSTGDPVLYVRNPAGVTDRDQREVIDVVTELNRQRQKVTADPEIATRIRQYELAFRMQTSVPALMDLSDETKATLDMYGTKGADGTFGGNCLLARRLAERGVRFIQLYHRGWDHHGKIKDGIVQTARLVDQGMTALLKDLRQRGLLDDTLVIWGGEFGRTPMFQGKGSAAGRDHHIRAFSMWLAGGGIKGGITHGETDELGYYATKDRVHVRDLHATMLHLLGIDSKRFTYRFQGLDARLTGVEDEAHVIKSIVT